MRVPTHLAFAEDERRRRAFARINLDARDPVEFCGVDDRGIIFGPNEAVTKSLAKRLCEIG
jgi:hypothetical protein